MAKKVIKEEIDNDVKKEAKSTTKKAATKKSADTKKEDTKKKVDTAKKATAKAKKTTSAKKSATTTKKAETKKKPATSTKKSSSAKASAKTTSSKAKEPKKSAKETKTAQTSKASKTVKKTSSSSKIKTETKAKAEPKKKTTAKSKSTTKATSSKTTKAATTAKTTTRKSTAKPMLAEYYDLPYRYNETTVKILAQTPTTLFVYWDISDNDRQTLLERHGENMFYETRPILIIHNTTKNYSFEIEINDFANSWYIRTQEPDCNYVIELGRKPIDHPEQYIYIHSSNNITSPNDHILFEKADLGNVLFRNVKTNVLSSKDFGSLRFINDIDKLYGNVYDVYSKLYGDGALNEILIPSSNEFVR